MAVDLAGTAVPLEALRVGVGVPEVWVGVTVGDVVGLPVGDPVGDPVGLVVGDVVGDVVGEAEDSFGEPESVGVGTYGVGYGCGAGPSGLLSRPHAVPIARPAMATRARTPHSHPTKDGVRRSSSSGC